VTQSLRKSRRAWSEPPRVAETCRSWPALLALIACLFATPRAWAESTINWRPETGGGPVHLTTLPSTRPADMGVLQIKGQFIKSLQIERRIYGGRNEWFTLAPPPAEVRLPAGEYGWDEVELQHGNSPCLGARGYGTPFKITRGQTTTLRIGGPLKPQVQAAPRGTVVDITYSLTGMANEVYTRTDNRSPPQFTVTKGGRQIGAGTFEYG